MTFQTGAEITDVQTVNTVNVIGNGTDLAVLLGDPANALQSTIETSFRTNFAGGAGAPTVTDMNNLNTAITRAIDYVSTQRATFGAQVNRLNSNINNLSALFENLSAANSRITDTDYANETASLTKTQILQQAATAMLSQANAQPNVVLALLK